MNERYTPRKDFYFKTLNISKLIDMVEEFISTQVDPIKFRKGATVYNVDSQREIFLNEVEIVFLSNNYKRIYLRAVDEKSSGNRLDIFIEQKPNILRIYLDHESTTNGAKIIDSFVKELSLITTYDYRLLKIKNKDEKSYMEEAFICRNNQALRAAVIMGWTCVMSNIYSKIDKKYKQLFLQEFVSRNPNKKPKKILKIEDYQQFKDSEIIDISKKISCLNQGLAKRLREFLDMRNDCGHVRKWKPSEETVDAFFGEIFNSLY